MPAAPTGGGHRRPPVLDRLLPPSGNGPGVGLGRDPWLHRGADPAGFADLLDLAGVDELLTRRGLRTPFLRVAKDGRTLGDREFTTGGGVGASIPDQLDAATLAPVTWPDDPTLEWCPPGHGDVYVSLGQVKKYNLRKGDAVVGSIKQPREGEQQGRQKYNALVSIEASAIY